MELHIENYNVIRKDRAGPERGEGMAIYYNTKFLAGQRYDISSSCFYSIWLELSLPNKSKILISSIYRPPNSDFDKFQLDFEEIMEKLSPGSKETIILGDLNCDMSNERLPSEAKSLGQLFTVKSGVLLRERLQYYHVILQFCEADCSEQFATNANKLQIVNISCKVQTFALPTNYINSYRVNKPLIG